MQIIHKPKLIVKASTCTNAPFSRPNVIAEEEVERQGCRESRDGPGRPFAAGLWISDEVREPGVAGPMVGACFLCLLFFRKE